MPTVAGAGAAQARYRSLPGRVAIANERANLQAALASGNAATIATARAGLDRARTTAREAAADDEAHAQWLASLQARQQVRLSRAEDPEGWERAREQRRIQLAHARRTANDTATGAASAEATGARTAATDRAATREREVVAATRAQEAGRGAAPSNADTSPEVREALRRHAHRVARLRRVYDLAVTADDADTIGAAEHLLDVEMARHGAVMSRFGYEIDLETDL